MFTEIVQCAPNEPQGECQAQTYAFNQIVELAVHCPIFSLYKSTQSEKSIKQFTETMWRLTAIVLVFSAGVNNLKLKSAIFSIFVCDFFRLFVIATPSLRHLTTTTNSNM